MYSQPLVLFLKMKKKKRKERFFFLLNDFCKPAEKKDFMRNNIFFFCGIFFCLFIPLPPPYPLHILSPLKRTRDDEGFILYTCRVVLRPWICPINHTFNTGRDSVDSPSGCKVKTLMYSTFANELQKLFFFFQFQLSFNRFTTVVCLYNVTFCIFMCEKNTQGPRQFEFQLENI